MTIVSTRHMAVTGMTCDHCANAVRAEISKLPGVTGVDVDVAAGTVRVSGDPLPGDVSLREAVEEAGYEFAGEARPPGAPACHYLYRGEFTSWIGPPSPLTWPPSRGSK